MAKLYKKTNFALKKYIIDKSIVFHLSSGIMASSVLLNLFVISNQIKLKL